LEMPSSNILLISCVCMRIRELMPDSVLDIGIGFGKYGFLAREYLDIYEFRYQRNEWRIRIDGIEIFSKYIDELQRLIYDNIYIGDALDGLKRLGNYDLILLIDVIEHLEKERAKQLLKLVGEKSKTALVATPIRVKSIGAQFMKYGNKYEMHVSNWRREELEQFGDVTAVAPHLKGTHLLEIKSG